MNRIQLAALLQQPFCITQDYAQALLPIANSILTGNNAKEDFSLERAAMIHSMQSPTKNVNSWNVADAGADSVLVLNMKGPILKESQMCGPIGTLELAAAITAAQINSNIIGCVLVTESGGGAVYAIKPITDAITAFRSVKPIVALAEDLMCSAAYYIASYTNEILANNPKTQIGSIGTMISFTDIQPALEKQGVVFHDIYATKSTAKNKDFIDAKAGDYSAIITKMLDPINEDFISAVKTNRAGKISTSEKLIFEGETWFASIAKELGMIDGLGNLQDAVARVRELSINQKSITKKPNMKLENLIALAGIENPTQEQIDLANADLTTAGILSATIVAESFITEAAAATGLLAAKILENTNAEALLATSVKDLATAKANVLLLEGKVEAFGKNAGAIHNSQIAGEEEQPDVDKNDFQSFIDNLPHNKAADAALI